ncbi:hypothetical protein K491DRAFT_106953 [Lophiostoma macrostomum CBS 122681]|uniref:Zn(2)-C6 fungal-type domain-containing protein n=1 Tax=Lophiostoma macrostomum CBS 122681 TaxID=1314788 RepID=A0A6A6TJU8_9PLEO|nr:hypothetical protein K491DRAFT_106953 [Lophiostoma macrostomum CBS 122681]
MTLRKAHHKTKAGCTTCKKRRIKCDESRPICYNCSRRSLDCTYPQLPQKAGSGGQVLVFSKDAGTRPQQPAKAISPPVLLDTLSQTGLLEGVPNSLIPMYKKLLHHFVVETSTTVAPNSQDVWPRAVPQLTSSHGFVLDGVFALTSLHLSRLTSSETERKLHADIANARLNRGLVPYRKTLENVTNENAEGLFSFSLTTTAFILIIGADEHKALIESLVCDSATSHCRQDHIQEAVAQSTRVLRCLRGSLVILVPCWEQVSTGIIGAIVKRDWWPLPNPHLPEAIEEDAKLHALEKMWMFSGRRYEYYFDTLSTALLRLRHSFALASQLTIREGHDVGKLSDWTLVAEWATHISFGYVDLLERQTIEAWIILAHWAILVHRAEQSPETWWIKNMSHNLVSTAALVVGESKRHLLEWPARSVGVDLDRLWAHSELERPASSDPSSALSEMLSITDSIPRVSELPMTDV